MTPKDMPVAHVYTLELGVDVSCAHNLRAQSVEVPTSILFSIMLRSTEAEASNDRHKLDQPGVSFDINFLC